MAAEIFPSRERKLKELEIFLKVQQYSLLREEDSSEAATWGFSLYESMEKIEQHRNHKIAYNRDIMQSFRPRKKTGKYYLC